MARNNDRVLADALTSERVLLLRLDKSLPRHCEVYDLLAASPYSKHLLQLQPTGSVYLIDVKYAMLLGSSDAVAFCITQFFIG